MMNNINEVPEICKNCKRSITITYNGKKLELCKYKETLKELIKIADGDAGLKTHCNFREGNNE